MADRRQRGGALMLALLSVVLVAAAAATAALSLAAAVAQRGRGDERALAQAREALVAYAADRPIDPAVGPGYLPCPDLDDDGWAEPICGSLSGHLGQAERLGRLPWKTLGLPDLRDGNGERLWYAVSTRYKGLLNCAASAACVDMTPPAALGTITVRAGSGAVIHDGRLTDPATAAGGGAAAVIIAPGSPLVRSDGHPQRRDCAPGECDARGRCVTDPPRRAARCDPRNYLDAASFEDNADFHDRSDPAGRAGNANGFVQGPVILDGRLVVNDRVAAVAYPDVMARVMSRVGVELAHCIRLQAAALAGGPAGAEPRCGTSPHLGGIGDAALAPPACNAAASAGWWSAWKPHVLYARAQPPGLRVLDADGRTVAAGRAFALLVTQRANDCAEGRVECGASGCASVARLPRTRERFDALVASP